MDGPKPILEDSKRAAEEAAGYLQAVAHCGDKRPLLVSQPIFSSNGIKLLDTGAKIDSRILDRLFGHTLAEPIDRCLTSPDAVRHADLLEGAREQLAASPLLAHLDAAGARNSARAWSALAACPLPPAIAMRLTVLRDATPAVYAHCLRAAFLALFIGSSAGWSDTDLQSLATAALLHDLGMMHADPALFESGKPLDATARRSLVAHPLLGEIVARAEPLLSPMVAHAIAQHHERLDGSGYPHALQGEAICSFARALMLVEVALAVLENDELQPALQLSLILRLNHRSFDARLAAVLLAALPRVAAAETASADGCDACKEVISRLESWSSLRAGAGPASADPGASFIDERVTKLRRWLAEAGLGEPQFLADAGGSSPEVDAEVSALAREALWHLREIAYAALQRWPQLGAPPAATSSAAGRWIAENLGALDAGR